VGKRLYVGNLDYSVDDAGLKNLFTPYGEVKDSRVIKDRETGRSKGFGFVEMSTSEEAKKAIEKLNGFSQHEGGRAITVSEAKPPQDRR
jgi:cold-inducible RNA-binding protein